MAMVVLSRASVSRACHGVAALAALAAACPAQELLAEHSSNRGYAGDQDEFGSAVAFVGDVDGDGVVDALIAASGEDDGVYPWDHDDVGAVRLFSGSTGAILRTHLGTEEGGRYGLELAGGSDFDGDGLPDYVIASMLLPDPNGSSEGSVWVHSGATGVVLHSWIGERRFAYFGAKVRIVGDIDGDGVDDIGVGAPGHAAGGGKGDAGKAYLFSGATGALIRSETGTVASQELGFVMGVGDIDGDGRADYLLGSPGTGAGTNGQGSISVHSGASGSLLYTRNGEQWGSRFGANGCSLGDLDGDGAPDFAVSAHAYDAGAGQEGRIYAVSGRAGTKLWTIDGSHANEGLGVLKMTGDADFNRDGWRDLAIGTAYSTSSSTWASALEIHSGMNGRLLFRQLGADYKSGGSDMLGSSVDAIGDLDGDGFDDLLVGAMLHSTSNTSGEGRAYVFGGNDLLLQVEPQDAQPGDVVVADLRGGPPGLLGLLAQVAVSGMPRFDALLLAPFDAFGELQFSARVPPAVSGLDFTYQGFSQNRAGRGLPMLSLEVIVTVQ